MGLLSLFKKDWLAELDRVESYLEDEEPVLALDLLRRAERKLEGSESERIDALRQRAETQLFDSLLERAATSEREGKLSDAADWLLSALERCADDDPRRPELTQRREALLDQLEINPFAEGPGTPEGEAGVEASVEELEFHYEAIIETLRPELAEIYRQKPAPFPNLVIALNQGETAVALEGLTELLAADTEDPILRLERGRAHLMAEDLAAAAEDFLAVWESLGDGHLDRAGTLSVPLLWAESTLADNPAAVVERLAELAVPGRESVPLAEVYAMALLRMKDHGRALPYLQSMLRRYPSHVPFAHLLAQILVARDESREAIDCLEAAIGPSCSGGRCTAGPRHVPAIRTLAQLQLHEGEDPARCAELMAIVASTQGGRLGADDHRILARYYQTVGDTAAAEHAEAEAARLDELGPMAESAPTPSTGQQRVL